MVIFSSPFPLLLLLMMESQACLYMKCPENICSEGFRPWITIAFLKRRKKSGERERAREGMDKSAYFGAYWAEWIMHRDETWLQSKRYRRLRERQRKREKAGLKGQMKLVPSGLSDWSFYRVATAGEPLPWGGVNSEVANTESSQYLRQNCSRCRYW